MGAELLRRRPITKIADDFDGRNGLDPVYPVLMNEDGGGGTDSPEGT